MPGQGCFERKKISIVVAKILKYSTDRELIRNIEKTWGWWMEVYWFNHGSKKWLQGKKWILPWYFSLTLNQVMGILMNYGHEKVVWAGHVEKLSTGRAVFQHRILVCTFSFYALTYDLFRVSSFCRRERSTTSNEYKRKKRLYIIRSVLETLMTTDHQTEFEYSFGWRYTYESLKWITCSSQSREFILHL